ncbi:MAG: xylulokinase, partial [Rhodoferax sp.]|nr:xylulokinase [Rhodoferax sp.]
RSDYWAQMLSDIVNRPLIRREGGDFGPALGAARLARLGVDGGSVAESCPVPRSLGEFLPAPEQHAHHAQRRNTFHRLYRQLEPLYSST